MTKFDDDGFLLERGLVQEFGLVDHFLKLAKPEIAGLFAEQREAKPLGLADVIPRLTEVLVNKKTKPEQRAEAVAHLQFLLALSCERLGPGQPISGKFHAVLPQLIQASNDRADLVRQQAVSALGSFLAVCPVQEILPVLISTLTADKRPAGVVLAALASLRTCGVDAASGAVNELVDLLRHGDSQVHAEVCNVLGWLEQDAEPAIEELTRVAREDTTSAVCLAAVRALAAVDRSGRWICMLANDESAAQKIIRFLREAGAEGRELRRELQNAKLDDGDTVHGIDFRSVRWFGVLHAFTGQQAAYVKILWQHWEQGTPEVSQDAILGNEVRDPYAKRLDHAFRDKRFPKGHPAWGTMIVPGSTKGTYRLQEPGGKNS